MGISANQQRMLFFAGYLRLAMIFATISRSSRQKPRPSCFFWHVPGQGPQGPCGSRDFNTHLWPQRFAWKADVNSWWSKWGFYGILMRYLVGGFKHLLCSVRYGMSSFPLTNSMIFQDGKNHQTIFFLDLAGGRKWLGQAWGQSWGRTFIVIEFCSNLDTPRFDYFSLCNETSI